MVMCMYPPSQTATPEKEHGVVDLWYYTEKIQSTQEINWKMKMITEYFLTNLKCCKSSAGRALLRELRHLESLCASILIFFKRLNLAHVIS